MKYIGIALVVIAAIGLILSYYVGGLCSNNAYTSAMMVLAVVGLIAHIWLNKKYVD